MPWVGKHEGAVEDETGSGVVPDVSTNVVREDVASAIINVVIGRESGSGIVDSGVVDVAECTDVVNSELEPGVADDT